MRPGHRLYDPSYLADRIADLDNVLVVPAVPYGVCPYHMSFAGSIDLGYEGLYTVLRSIAFSLMQHGARRFLVLNGHGGNNPSIDKMALEVYHAGGICAQHRLVEPGGTAGPLCSRAATAIFWKPRP